MTTATPLQLVLEAADFAAQRHRSQRRKDGDVPYVNHPLAVARRLAAQAGVDDAVTLAAALLHDTIEDTGATHAELTRLFGAEVADVVAEVSDDKSLPKAERKREQIRHAGELSHRARLVKLADKLDNLEAQLHSTPAGWDAERVQGYFVWAHAVTAGLRGTCAPLEQALDEVFARQVELPGAPPFRAVPEDAGERDAVLRRYLAAMASAGD